MFFGVLNTLLFCAPESRQRFFWYYFSFWSPPQSTTEFNGPNRMRTANKFAFSQWNIVNFKSACRNPCMCGCWFGVWSVYVCETRHAKHVLYTGCQSRIAVFVISFYADTPRPHTHSIGLGMLYKSFSLQHGKSWQHGKYYRSNNAASLACRVSFLIKHFPMSNANWNWKEIARWV